MISPAITHTSGKSAVPQGFSTVECLVYLLLAALVLAVSLPSLHALVWYEHSVSKHQRAAAALETAAEIISSAAVSAAVLPDLQTLRISTASDTQWPLAGIVKKLHGKNAPAINSAMASVLQLEIEGLSQVLNSAGNSLEICANRFPATKRGGRGFWLGLGIAGSAVLSGTAAPGRASQACPSVYRISSLTPQAGLPLPSVEAPPAARFLVVVPVVDCFLLYLDSRETLRRVSLLSGENQPIAYGFSGFELLAKHSSAGAEIFALRLRKHDYVSAAQLPLEFQIAAAVPTPEAFLDLIL